MPLWLLALCYPFATFGLAVILGWSPTGGWARDWLAGWMITRPLVTLIECPACLGFWIGLVFGWLTTRNGRVALILAIATYGWNFLMGRATGLIPPPPPPKAP